MMVLISRGGLPLFWQVQIAGWVVYMVAIYITFLPVVPPSQYLALFYVKAFRAVTGFCLTVVLRQIYRRFAASLSVHAIFAIVTGCAVVFGCLWAAIEIGFYMLITPNFELSTYAIRVPSYALDYAMTLTGWSALYFGVKYWQRWQLERDNSATAATLANRAQLEMLRYQLNPHFLFNALNSIRASIDEDAKRAKMMVTRLADFLRYSLLAGDAQMKTLREEIEAVENYLAIEKIRFEDDLEVSIKVDEATRDFSLPCYLLNPLVENAIKHGFIGSRKPLKIEISAGLETSRLVVEVTNTGTLTTGESSLGTKVGLRNVRERLDRHFPGKSKFILSEKDGMVRARVEINI